VEIAWRRTEKDTWHPLKKEVIYRLEGKTSGPVSLNGDLVQAVKITTLNARLPEYLPSVTGHRDRYDLVFNAQGKRRTCSPGATAPQSLHRWNLTC
jgi:hypothetical protein